MEENKILTPEMEEGAINNKAAEEAVVDEAVALQETQPEQPAEEESLSDRVKVVSPGRLVAKRFFRSRLSMIGLITLIVLFAFSFIGPIFSPWKETEVDYSIPKEKRENYLTTNYVEKLDPNDLFVGGIINGTPLAGVEKVEGKDNVYTYERNGKTIYFMTKGGANAAAYVSDEDGNAISHYAIEYTWDRKTFNQLGKIDANHWLGTDEYGMDVFTRLMYGGRISLTLGFVVIILETILGVILGGLAGYFGKWVDQIIMRLVDIFNCIPQFPILLILSAVLDSMEIEANMKIYYLMGILTVIGWAGIARVVRGQILFLREQEYMVAAEALGLSVPRKIFRHLLPNVLPQLIVQMTLGLGGIILTESTLSYLGIGIPIPGAAWGTMISAAQKPEILQGYPNLWVPAGILIVLAVLAFNFVGDGLRDAFDPKASR